jgi:hypothetical protein
MSDANLRLLLDRAAISDTVYAYATGLDRRDWALYRSIFTDQIEMDFASTGIRAGVYDADRWVRDAKRLFAGFSATQHTSANHVHEVRGDEATCVSNMQAEHFVERVPDDGLGQGENRWTIGGYYVNELVRTADGWKLCKVTLNVTWSTGNPDVAAIALKRGRAGSA